MGISIAITVCLYSAMVYVLGRFGVSA